MQTRDLLSRCRSRWALLLACLLPRLLALLACLLAAGVCVLGRYSGVGKLTALNGDTYCGDFKAGTFHGKGCYTFRKGGGSYTGEFREGLFAGQGKEVYPDGSIYVGGFDNSKRSGVGSMHYANGAVFTGVWKSGKKEGRGSFKYSDGTRFDGKFADGKREGVGFIYDKKARKLQGKWKEGKLLNGKLTRVLHKQSVAPAAGAENSGEEDAHGAEGGGALMLGAADHAGAMAGADSDELTESKDSIDGGAQHHLTAQSAHSTPATKLRQRIPQLQGSSMSALSSPAHASSASSSSSSLPSRKPLSASREKELTNNLLNFSKKQQGIMLLARSVESAREARQARERAELIKQLAGAAHSGRGGSGLSTTESSSSSSSSTSHSSAASTTTQSPMLQPSSKQQHRYDSVLAPLAGIGGGGESSGVDSELAGTADDADADDATHGAAASVGGRASSEVHEWLASKDDPTHVSNSHSQAATPAPLHSNGSLLSSPRSTPLSRQTSKTLGAKQPRQYLSSGSEKEGEAISPRSLAAAAARIHSSGGGVEQAAGAAALPAPAAASASSSAHAASLSDLDAGSADESAATAASVSKPNGSPAKTKHPVVLTAR